MKLFENEKNVFNLIEDAKLDFFKKSLKSKQDILNKIDYLCNALYVSSINKGLTLNFLDALYKMLIRIRKLAEETEFIDLSGFELWSYKISIKTTKISIIMQKLKIKKCDNKVNFEVQQEFEILKLYTKMLTVEDYANLYDIEVVTVRQWIRRGKIRSAQKLGSEWRIPELAIVHYKKYQSVKYYWKDRLTDIPQYINFINDYNEVEILQSHQDKKIYKLIFMDKNKEKQCVIECDVKLKEKIELYMISSPLIQTNDNIIFQVQY